MLHYVTLYGVALRYVTLRTQDTQREENGLTLGREGEWVGVHEPLPGTVNAFIVGVCRYRWPF